MIEPFSYSDLSWTAEKELLLILSRITHHIHPNIVSYITKENVRYQSNFQKICNDKCKLSQFFYRDSDCIFPGFRRPVNKEKTGKWKNNVNHKDGTILTIIRFQGIFGRT